MKIIQFSSSNSDLQTIITSLYFFNLTIPNPFATQHFNMATPNMVFKTVSAPF